jgi:5-methylcytosine-specific restriction endonuclease McrA
MYDSAKYKEYYQKNRIKEIERSKRYRRKNREDILIRKLKRYGFDINDYSDCKCCFCGGNYRLAVHHKDRSGNTNNPNDSLDNLMMLCNSCHSSLHKNEYNYKQYQENGKKYLRTGREREYCEEWYKNNRNKMKIYYKKYYKKNKDKWKIYAKNKLNKIHK